MPIRLADSRVIYSEGVGSILFRPLINGQLARDVEFARVLHVPALRNNLLSVLYLTKHKAFDVHISGDHMDFMQICLQHFLLIYLYGIKDLHTIIMMILK